MLCQISGHGRFVVYTVGEGSKARGSATQDSRSQGATRAQGGCSVNSLEALSPYTFLRLSHVNYGSIVWNVDNQSSAAYICHIRQESLLAIVSKVCEMHRDNRPFWKHPWICLANKPGNLNIYCLWLWVNDILLDSSNEALVIDCCILLDNSIMNIASVRLGTALDYCRALGSSPINFIEVRLCFEGID